jgi:hypothetical protein
MFFCSTHSYFLSGKLSSEETKQHIVVLTVDWTVMFAFSGNHIPLPCRPLVFARRCFHFEVGQVKLKWIHNPMKVLLCAASPMRFFQFSFPCAVTMPLGQGYGCDAHQPNHRSCPRSIEGC